MTLRDAKQKEFADLWLNSDRKNILLLAPRFGKIRTSIIILKKLKPKNILICYPDKQIEQSWKNDFKELEFDDSIITYTTHRSIEKQINKVFDIIIIDEIHLLSENQIENYQKVLLLNKTVLGLTGTMTKETQENINFSLFLPVIANYTIEQAIKDKVIVNYQINVIKVALDNKILKNFSGKQKTEKKQFDNISWVINSLQNSGKDTMFMRLARMRIIQSSISKLNVTKELLNNYKNERILVFCGTTKFADSLEIASHHSKSLKNENFTDFANGIGNHLAVVKIGNSGITYKPLNKVIISYFDSNAENLTQKINRCMAMEYATPDKKAEIYIITTNESVELKWLQKSLSFFNKEKIKYIEKI